MKDKYQETKLNNDYDPIAIEYAEKYFDELDHKPIDRELLDELISLSKGLGKICDLGCGPGQVARYIHQNGGNVIGIDLSAEMVATANGLNPEISFFQGDMRGLDLSDDTLGGIAAFYSIIHIPPAEVLGVLEELHRVLAPGGWLLLAIHIGESLIHLDEMFEKNVFLDFHLYQPEEMKAHLADANFEKIRSVERDPYPDVEYQGRRAYIFARKPE